MNWMSVLGLCLIVLGTVFSFFGTVYSSKQSQSDLTLKIQEKNNTIDDINANNVRLIEQNSSLLSTTNKVSNTNNDLINQNKEMLLKVANYQSDIEQRNLKIQKLESDIDNVKEYSYYSTMDIKGQTINAGNGLTYSSDLSNRMKKLLIEVEGKSYVKNDLNNISQIDEVISKYPKFPFGYWARYNVLKAFHKPEWKADAKKCVEIFKITTSIEGHNQMHDEALKLAEHDLETNQ